MSSDLTSQHPNLVVREQPKAMPDPAPAMDEGKTDMAKTMEDMVDSAMDKAKDMAEAVGDVIEDAAESAMDMAKSMGAAMGKAAMADAPGPVVGFVVITEGPGMGAFAPLYDGVNDIGSAPERSVALTFGDGGISPESHAIIAYDARNQMFQLNQTGQRVLVRHNDNSVLGPVALENGDMIEISKTKLRFVPVCGKDFAWPEEN